MYGTPPSGAAPGVILGAYPGITQERPFPGFYPGGFVGGWGFTNEMSAFDFNWTYPGLQPTVGLSGGVERLRSMLQRPPSYPGRSIGRGGG